MSVSPASRKKRRTVSGRLNSRKPCRWCKHEEADEGFHVSRCALTSHVINFPDYYEGLDCVSWEVKGQSHARAEVACDQMGFDPEVI